MNRKALPRLLALFLVAALAVTHLNAQQNIPSHLLNKYNSDELFLDDNEVDVSGTWKGIEVQYDWSGSVITTEYEYTLELQQDGNRVTGQSLIYDKMNDWWATMTLRGFVLNGKLHFEEYIINNEVIDKGTMVWCYTTGELDITPHNGKSFLVGPLEGYASNNFNRCPMVYVTLEQIAKPDSPADPNAQASDPNQDLLDQHAQNHANDMTAYPNPFDKAINLEYRIEEDAYVTLSVFDLTGKKITTLVDGEQKASTYKVVFDATKHKSASATYIARLTVGDKVYTKQFIQVN